MTDDSENVARDAKRSRWRPGLASQVLIGLVLGLATGLFLGEFAGRLKIVGDIFIGLLQMTVLPYILVSLVAALGRLSYAEVRTLALRGGIFVLIFWIVALGAVVGIALSFPDWESATFFSTSLAAPESSLDMVQLYVPTNPFHSLANTIIPAIVVFSVAMGLAVIGVPGKVTLLGNLEILEQALLRIAGAVARTAPIGVFALVANAAGTLEVEALARAQVYIALYICTALLLSLWVVPGLVSVLTPLSVRRVLSSSQDALITAFATGSLLIVIPLIAQRAKGLLDEIGARTPEAESAVDLMVPVNFNLPNMGKLLTLSFALFAGWYSGSSVPATQYPMFLVAGLASFFGEVIVALPFLLDLLRIPADFFQLFIPVDLLTGRFGTLLAGVHTVAQALLTAAAVAGVIRLRWAALGRYLVVTLVLALTVFVGLRLFFEHVVPHKYRAYEQLVRMDVAIERAKFSVRKLDELEPLDMKGAGRRLDAIVKRGTLRIGYRADALPYVYTNSDGKLVGFDIDLAHLLAADLGVGLEFVRVHRRDEAALLDQGQVDIVAGGYVITPERALRVRYSVPYMDATLALVVPDHERSRFLEAASLRSDHKLRIAVPNVPYYQKLVRTALPNAKVVTIESPREYFTAKEGTYDALVYTAEAGSAWTLVFPRFSVVVPKPRVIATSIALALPRNAPELDDYVSTWLTLKKKEGVIRHLYDYWILGRGAKSTRPRWSVIRNVLGWVE